MSEKYKPIKAVDILTPIEERFKELENKVLTLESSVTNLQLEISRLQRK